MNGTTKARLSKLSEGLLKPMLPAPKPRSWSIRADPSVHLLFDIYHISELSVGRYFNNFLFLFRWIGLQRPRLG
jgi:hypothetical protein